MAYSKYYTGGWASGENGNTPITPEALNHMEQGIQDAVPTVLTENVHFFRSEEDLPPPGTKGKLYFVLLEDT